MNLTIQRLNELWITHKDSVWGKCIAISWTFGLMTAIVFWGEKCR